MSALSILLVLSMLESSATASGAVEKVMHSRMTSFENITKVASHETVGFMCAQQTARSRLQCASFCAEEDCALFGITDDQCLTCKMQCPCQNEQCTAPIDFLEHIIMYRPKDDWRLCKTGYKLVGCRWCVLLVRDNDMNFDDAVAHCISVGSHLIIIDSFEKSQAIQDDLSPSDTWIGGRTNAISQPFYWVETNETFSWTNWDSDPPTDLEKTCCLMKGNNGWQGERCDNKKDVLCEHPHL